MADIYKKKFYLFSSPVKYINMIRNIIFDFGGVILNIDPSLTLRKFYKLGLNPFDPNKYKKFNKNTLYKFETGKITPEEFRNNLREVINPTLTDKQIDYVWNLTILDYPPERIKLLKQLKKNYRLFLLSNTNIIHFQKYIPDFKSQFGFEFESLFEKVYWSFEMGLRKPEPGIFLHVLEENKLLPAETLFIDDSAENLTPAKQHGIQVHHLKDLDILGMFENNQLKI
ncbi:MAG: HAD family phosphatase [Bacteroidales bacterium]|nr:HAD family phosphatase [Bacteroidales bacterium]